MLRLFVRKGRGEAQALREWAGRNDGGDRYQILFGGSDLAGRKHVAGEAEEQGSKFVIDVVEDGEVAAPEPDSFDVSQYFSLLGVKGLRAPGRRLLYAPQVASTQEILFGPTFSGWEYWRLAFVADQQSHGKGRGENTWVSPKGCLMCSFQIIHQDGVKLPMMQYLVALSIIDAVRRLPNGEDVYQKKNLKIKWPNDIYCEGKNGEMTKIGGIICQSSYWKGEFVVTVGFGLNVSNAEPTQCLDNLFESLGYERCGREKMLASFFTVLEPCLEEFERTGFKTFKHRYEAAWMHSGQKLSLEDGSSVLVDGITDDGLLLVHDVTSGAKHALQPDGNSLNWFQGLIKRKTK